MRYTLGIPDVVAQVAITALVHWATNVEWTADGFLERAGVTVPAALIAVALLRVWRERPAT